MPAAFCPHCQAPVEPRIATTGGRCITCRLFVGPGRARATQDVEQMGSGSASAVLGNAARRLDADAGDPEEIAVALQAASEQHRCAIDRLRMVDYDTAVAGGLVGPTLAVVLATHGSWKAARRAAAELFQSAAEASEGAAA